DAEADREDEQDVDRRGLPVGLEAGDEDRGEVDRVRQREVDAAEQDHDRLADGDDPEIRGRLPERAEMVRREEVARRQPARHERDADERERHRHLERTHVAAGHPRPHADASWAADCRARLRTSTLDWSACASSAPITIRPVTMYW